MTTKNQSILAGGLILVLLIAASATIAYTSTAQNKFNTALKKFYPAAIVAGNFISIYDWDNYLAVSKKLDPTSDSATAIQALVKKTEEKQVMTELRIPYTQAEVTTESNFLTAGSTAEVSDLIQNYFGGDKSFFNQYLVLPEFYDSQLEIYYNSNTTLNAAVYKQAQAALTQLENGANFADVAKADSADQESGQMGGDLGFVPAGQILPELQAAIAKAPVGSLDKTIAISRAGYHILYVVETSDQGGVMAWHVKHILFQITGFDTWLAAQTKNFHVWQIVKSK